MQFDHETETPVDLVEHGGLLWGDHLLEFGHPLQAKLGHLFLSCSPALDKTVGLLVGQRVVVLRVLLNQGVAGVIDLRVVEEYRSYTGQNLTASPSISGRLAATIFFLWERMS